jgi:type IV pilus assembly protein PilQ
MILRTKGLTMRQNGNVIYIAPAEEIVARETLELEAIKKREELVPLRSDIIQINYAKAEELAALIKEGSSNDAGDEKSLLSERGEITADARTNKLLVQDVPEKLTEIRELISELDIPVRQVMIDARIVLARDDFSKDLGVNFGGAFVRRNGDYGVSTIAGTSAGTDTIVNSAANNLQNTGQAFPTSVPDLSDRLGVNLLGVGPSLAFAILGQDYLLDLELSALAVEGRGETLSNPRVITTDRKEAVIKQGEEIPFQTISDQGTQTEFRDAVLELKVTPQITPDGRVLMDLAVKKDERGELTPDAGPAINTREVTTQVLVNNGETVVLGGIFEKVSALDVNKVPFLGDLPAIGRLFRRNQTENTKFELLIFVTPQIIQEGVAVR